MEKERYIIAILSSCNIMIHKNRELVNRKEAI